MDSPPEKIKAAPVSESSLQGFGTCEEPITEHAEHKARIIAAIRDYLAHGHSTFRARQIQVEGSALRKGRK